MEKQKACDTFKSRAKSPIIISSSSKMDSLDCNSKLTSNMHMSNKIQMGKQKIYDTFKSRAKSPIIMSSSSKMDSLDCNSKSTSNMHGLNKIKKTQEITELLVKSPIDHSIKSLKHLKACSNLQSTPNTRNFKKIEIHSESIMNLSPIVSVPTVKTIPNSEKDICYDKSNSNNFSLDQMNKNLSNLNNKQVFDNRLKKHERIKKSTNKINIHDSPVLSVHPVKKNENLINNEKAKRCLFENENANSISNFENDQDSLNISLDVLEQVCQMSEMMGNSSSEETQINVNIEKKNSKLASFLYGNNNTAKLDDTKEENELLQLALSMEDSIKTENKSKNKLSFEGEFTSLNQLKKNKTNLSESSDDIDDIRNIQMSEISNIAEPLESFDDQWTQQYFNSNASSLNNGNKEDNYLNINKTATSTVFKLINEKKDALFDNITSNSITKEHIIFKDQLNDSSATYIPITNPSACIGFSTAGGKSIEVSDKALLKVQSMLKDELDVSSTVIVPKKALLEAQSVLNDVSNRVQSPSNSILDISINCNKINKGSNDSKLTVDTNTRSKIFDILKDEEEYTLEDLSLIDTVEKFERDKINHKQVSKKKHLGSPTYELNRKIVPITELKSSINGTDYDINEKIDDVLNNKTNKTFTEAQLTLKAESDIFISAAKDKSIINPNMCKGFSTAGGKSIEVSDKALQKVQSILKDDLNGLELFDNPPKTMEISTGGNNTTEELYNSKLTVTTNSKSNIFEFLNNEEEYTIEDLSLIDTVEKFEIDKIKQNNPILNKCSGNSTYEINHKNAMLITSIDDNDDKKNEKYNNLSSNTITSKNVTEIQFVLENELGDLLADSKSKTTIDLNICKGFSTAGGKSIEVSDEALQKIQSMLKDELDISSAVAKGKTIANPSVCKGFSTAGGKSIEVSDKTLQKVQSMLKDELDFTSAVAKGKTIANSSVCKGFSTAGGKSIEVSDKALQKVQSMLKDELDISSAVAKGETIANSSVCKGFSTAGGKSIEVSDKALQKVQSMLKDELDISSAVAKGKIIANPSIYKGFSTAGGKSIKVSDKALQKVQSMLKDELDISSTVTKGKTIANPSVCKGFSTAGGKSIEVSDKALQKVQSMLKDELDISSAVAKGKTIANPSVCKGFSTAGGKSIEVSDKALQKVQSMLKDELDISSAVAKGKTIANSSVCKGFSTAGGKSIEVSDKTLQKVQSMLKDELDFTSAVAKGKTIANPSVCKGFSTAGGKSIEVSEKALQKVQSILKDDLYELQPLTNSHQKIDISIDSKKIIEEVNDSKLTVGTNLNSTFFEILKNDEECNFEDLSLIDTVEKFEKYQIKNNPTLRNKRPGSPIFETNCKIKRCIPDENWESEILKNVFDDYLSKKLNGQKVSLLEAVDWIKPKTYSMKIPVNSVNSAKVELLKLNTYDALNLKLYWDYELSDNNRNKMYDFQDIKILFLSHNFVDDKLIPKRWIENHFCLIAWKLAATENSFPNHFGNKLLNAKNIILQLLYRYYREIEKCERSALKKILEKDESATKRIILCVSKVIKTNIPEIYNIELTDGWYRVQGQVDFEMNMLLHRGIVKVGTKLLIYNAELIGAGEGIDPLEVLDDVKLKISTNSTRRVRWHTKLGFYRNSTLPIPITLESVLPRGGIIGSLSLVILRKYPMMYFERKSNSKSVLRNEKIEALEAKKFEDYKQKSLEIISNQIETELTSEMSSITNKSKKCFLSLKKENVDKLSIDELSNIIENSTDPLEIQSLLSQDKLDAVNNFKKSEQERFYNELQSRINRVFNDQFKDARKVTPLFKLRVVDEKYASTGFKSAILTMWNPSEDVISILNKSNEGQCCKFHHLTVNGFKNGVLQISANKNTRFNFHGCKDDYAKRDVINFKSIWSGDFVPLFGELDFVGIVVSNINKNNNNYDEVYVSDQEMNIVSILFQSDIKEYGCDDMMYPGNIISGTNIQFRGFNPISSLPKLYNTEYSSFTTIPKTEHILNTFNNYKMFIKKSENQDFLKCCQGKLSEICNKNVEAMTITDESMKPQCSNTLKKTLHKSQGELPINIVKNYRISQSEYSPAQKKIKILNTSYGKTPPLNIIHTKAPDKKLMSQFKTPSRL